MQPYWSFEEVWKVTARVEKHNKSKKAKTYVEPYDRSYLLLLDSIKAKTRVHSSAKAMVTYKATVLADHGCTSYSRNSSNLQSGWKKGP